MTFLVCLRSEASLHRKDGVGLSIESEKPRPTRPRVPPRALRHQRNAAGLTFQPFRPHPTEDRDVQMTRLAAETFPTLLDSTPVLS